MGVKEKMELFIKAKVWNSGMVSSSAGNLLRGNQREVL